MREFRFCRDATGAIRTDKTTQTVPTEATNGKIIVTSKEMANHAVKTIKFTAYLEGHETDLYHEVVIKHFPVDNIQQFTGSWSSRNTSTTAYQYRTTNASGYDLINSYTPYNPGYPWFSNDEQINEYTYYSYVNQGLEEYVYYTGNNWNRRYFRYRWQVYRRSANLNWIDWETDQTNHSQVKAYNDANFKAKIYYNNTIYTLIDEAVGNQYKAAVESEKISSISSLENNRMYVVQISSTSDEYVLGKPILTKGRNTQTGQYTQSDDDVVSPAFMIASQLGAVSPFTGDDAALNAAIHCSTYMEVGTDETRYTGWRLPTAEEIAVIADRQNDPTFTPDVIVEVLGGDYYYNLSGGRSFVKGKNPNSDNTYVRCVRDLTEADLKRLNGE